MGDLFEKAMTQLWQEVDILLAPAAPTVAPPVNDDTIMLDGKTVSARANLGIFTQPISLARCPVLTVPVMRRDALPLGIQLIAAPHREDALFALAHHLERAGLIGITPPGAP